MACGGKVIGILGLVAQVVPIVVRIPLFDISSIGRIALWLKNAISSVLYGPEPRTPDYIEINAIEEELRALEEERMCTNVITNPSFEEVLLETQTQTVSRSRLMRQSPVI